MAQNVKSCVQLKYLWQGRLLLQFTLCNVHYKEHWLCNSLLRYNMLQSAAGKHMAHLDGAWAEQTQALPKIMTVLKACSHSNL